MMEIPKFLIEMSEQMNNEDVRATSDPVWQVRCKRTRPTDSDYSDTFQLMDRENDYSLVATNKECGSINQQIVNYLDCDPDDLPVIFESWVDSQDGESTSGENKIKYFLNCFDCETDALDGIDLIWVEEYEDIVKGAFLTEEDANWFIKRKQHDYPKLYTYVESLCFCPQMIELRSWIKSLSAVADNKSNDSEERF